MTEMKEKNIYPSVPDIREQPSAPGIVNGVPMIADTHTD